MLAAYRRTGADPPFGDPRRPHGVAMEGWFWRFTEPSTGAVVVALAAVNRAADGRAWGTVGLAAHPGGFSASVAVDSARATDDGAVTIGDVLEADAQHVRVRLDGAVLDVALGDGVPWPHRAFGGIGAAHAIPGLTQYWHPWLLDARVRGHAVAGGRTIALDGAAAYAEKNWSNGGFPDAWWWGQAQAFEGRDDVCVAFAGGHAGIGRLRVRNATALVVSAGGEVLRLVRPLQPLHVQIADGSWLLRGRTARGTAVEVEGHANGTAPHLLPIPVPAEGRNRADAAAQHLAGELRVALRRRGSVLYEGTSRLAGLERGNGKAPTSAAPPA